MELAQKFFDDEQKIIRSGRPMIDLEEHLYYHAGGETWLLTTKVPVRNARGDVFGVAGVSRDITDRRLSDLLRDGHAQILEMIAMSAPLASILDALARLVESQLNGILCSVLLLDDDGRRLRHGAAPSLAPEYVKAIDGTEIGPCVGSCGTAAYRRQPVIVTDVLADPLWADYRELVRPYGYRSCWSTPILSNRGEVLAVFAMYSRTVRAPTSVESRLLEMAIHIAGIAIARRRAEERIQFMATHDELTGLPNRARFGEQLAEALQSAARRGAWLGVVYADFDNFKFVNDSLGHSAGDALLKTMAERIVAAVGPNNIVSRLGGDEFVVLLVDPPKDTPTISAMLHRIRSAVVARWRWTVAVSASRRASARRSIPGTAGRPRPCSPTPTPRCTAPRNRAATTWCSTCRRSSQSARAPDAARRLAQRRSEPRLRSALSAAGRSAQRRAFAVEVLIRLLR